MFDLVTPAVVLADHTLRNILNGSRAARLVEQNAFDSSIPGLADVLDEIFDSVFDAAPANPYEAEISRAVEWVAVTRIMGLAASAAMPQVRAVALSALESRKVTLDGMTATADPADAAHFSLLSGTIDRFLKDPTTAPALPAPPNAPPGAPIGLSPQDYLGGSEWIGQMGPESMANPWMEFLYEIAWDPYGG
jgi:hypothetical protein